MGSDQQFCLRWHNYQSSLLASLPQLLDGDDLTDVTLSAGGRNLRAHRVVLSACSLYFKELFKVLQPLQHPVIVLPGASFTDLCALVTFMYSGEVNIYQEQLPGLLNMADAMQIRGLAEVNGTAGKISGNENISTSKKESVSSSTKRAKLSSHTSVMNQSSAETKLPQAETVDLHGHFVKGKVSEYGLYGGNPSRSSKQPTIENDLHYGNFQKESGPKAMTMSDSLDLYVENVPSRKSVRSSKMEAEDMLRRSSPVLAMNANVDGNSGTRVKLEREHNTEGVASTRISPDLASVLKKAAGVDEMELGNADNSSAQAQQSPSSEDSGGGNFTSDPAVAAAAANRIHLSPGPHFSTMKLSSNSRLSPHTSSKLFATCLVCGKQLSNQYNLRVHMETHQNINYACGVCSHVSRSRDALRKHVSYRHPPEGRDKAAISGPRERKIGSESRNRLTLAGGANNLDGKNRGLLSSNGIGMQITDLADGAGSNGIAILGKGIERSGEEIANLKIEIKTGEENKHP